MKGQPILRGGECRDMREGPSHHADGVEKREPIWIARGPQGGFMHKATNRKMCQQQAIVFLQD